MAFQLPEPPEWWVKYKPLRWILLALVVYWVLGTLLPRWRAEAPLPDSPAKVATAEPEAGPADAPPTEDEPPEDPAPEAEPVAAEAPPEAPTEPPAPDEPPTPAPDPTARYTAVESERVTLLESFRSYEKLETIQGALQEAGFDSAVDTIERTRRRADEPPFRNDTLTVNGYTHGDHEGKLTLEFFNDRLYQAVFSPKADADKYLDWLRGRGLKLPVKRVGQARLTEGHLRVNSNIDFASSDVGRAMNTEPFVRWEDVRLVEQLQEVR